jgi:aminopeptidase N
MTLPRRCIVFMVIATTAVAQPVFTVRDEGEARSRTYDVLHYTIKLSFDEPNRKVIGRVTTSLVPFLEEFTTIVFDAEQMQIQRVTMGKKELRFELEPKKLVIHLDRVYSLLDTLTVSVEYSCIPKRGLYFVQPDSAYPDKPWQIWTQGEDMDNHFWFPCYDFPNDRATSEMFITVKSAYVAVSNGGLVGIREDTKEGTKTFHWRVDRPHVSYLIMMAAGNYALLKDRAGSLPLEYYVYPSQIEDAKVCFSKTADMITFFNEKIGFPYAWEKYAQILCRDFVVGGMENTSATTLIDEGTVFNARARVDESPTSLIAHELAHQWWGDVVTCKDWRHLWLNESFASYFDPLYHEHLLGRDEFDQTMSEAQQAGINADKRLGRKPIVSVGSYGENVYPRGASVLHMIRFLLGDRLFWRAIHHYITKHQFSVVETNDFKIAIEEATGQNLSWFFDQWVYRAGYPVFDVSYHWNDTTRAFLLHVRQTQTMDSLTGIFRTPVEIAVTSSGRTVTHRLNILSSDTIFVLPATGEPDLVIFDNGNWLIKELNFSKPAREWKYQAEFARNPVDRKRAVQELLTLPDTLACVQLLARVAQKDTFWAVRREAVTGMARFASVAEPLKGEIRMVLLAAARDRNPSVRNAAVAQLGHFQGEDVISTLRAALKDSSYSVEASALRSLAKADSGNAMALLTSYLDVPSHRNIVSNAALGRLPSIDSSKAIAVALQKVRYGQPGSTRFAAMNILSRYARTHRDLMPTLVSLTDDKNTSIRYSALRSLGEAGDMTVLPVLDRIAADPSDRGAEVARESAERIRARTP